MLRTVLALFIVVAGVQFCQAAEPLPPQQVEAAMRKATGYFRNRVAVHGGYVYYTTTDLKVRLGEGPATATQIWVQPPGTPTVGMAMLRAYKATGDRYYLDGAQAAAEALAFGQLRGGGWTNSIDCQGMAEGWKFSGGKKPREGNCSLDDGQTQSAILLLVLTDQTLKFKHPVIHNAAMTSLKALLAAQFPNGAFPQVWRKPVEPQPVLQASFPEYDWRTEGRIKNYWDLYTLNDNVAGYVTKTLITAHQVYNDNRYLKAVAKLGDFLILAQMPEPQPGWAQQYNYKMHPVWARKFEPAAISGDETQETIQTLFDIYLATGDAKYLAPVPAALAWLKRSQLPDGQLARYYELKTNRPLYMVRKGKQYSLTYSDKKLPKHYAFKNRSKLDELTSMYKRLKSGNKPVTERRSREQEVRSILSSLDEQGRWVSVASQGERLVGQPRFAPNAKYLSSAVFSHNLEVLSGYLLNARTRN